MNKFKDQTGIGIVTCNRPDYVHKVIESISPDVGDIYVMNGGANFKFEFDDPSNLDKITKLMKGQKDPTPVGHGKNKLLREMRHDGKEYLFLIEDDVRIKNNEVFEKYITTAAETGLWAGQLCYGPHGGAKGGNVKPDGTPNNRTTVDYKGCSVDLYPQSLQAFSLYHSNAIRVLGYMDERFINAAEHLDHYYHAFELGLGNYFWWFPDIENSWQYIEDIDQNHEGSVIRKSDEWSKNMARGWELFKKKYGLHPNAITSPSEEEVLKRLEFIEENYSKKDLI